MSSVVFGIIAHMYVMTNLCPQPDVYSALFGYGAGYTSGRWGLALLGDFVHVIFGNYSMPWLNGMLSVLFLALSSLCVIEVLDIRNEADSILISAVMVTFPSVIGIFTFIFTTPYYCFSVFLMCLSVYSIKKYGSGGWSAASFYRHSAWEFIRLI